MRITLAVLVAFTLLSLAGEKAHAQFFGSASLGFNSSSNVEALDTTATADKLVLPALFLGYDIHPSAVTRINLNASYAPSIYTETSTRSYTTSSLGANGYFYLSNHDAIEREAASERATIASGTPVSNEKQTAIEAAVAEDNTSEIDVKQSAANDLHTQNAISALYVLSSSLDSVEFEPTKSRTAKQADALNDRKDSLSEQAITIADLLDAGDLSEASRDVALQELHAIENGLSEVATAHKRGAMWKELIRSAISDLNKLNFNESPSPSHRGKSAKSIDDPFGPVTTLATLHAGFQQNIINAKPSPGPAPVTSSHSASPFLLIASSSRFRFFDATDISVLEDQYEPSATTYATLLSVPLSLEFRRNRPENIDRNYSSTAIGAALETFVGEAAGLRFSFDHINSNYPNDTAYTNNENRFRLGSRIALGSTTALLPEGILGFRKYLKPLTFTATGKILKKAKGQSTTVASDFSQWTLGAGLAQWFGERFVLGALGSITRNPNLRPYLTQRPNDLATSNVGVSDDEYTYDLDRYVAFATTRLPWDLDAGLDVALEHRQYGSLTDRKGALAAFANESVGGGRTEDGTNVRGSISKFFMWDERLLGIFTGFIPEFSVTYTDVSSSVSRYSYTDFSTLLQFTLNF